MLWLLLLYVCWPALLVLLKLFLFLLFLLSLFLLLLLLSCYLLFGADKYKYYMFSDSSSSHSFHIVLISLLVVFVASLFLCCRRIFISQKWSWWHSCCCCCCCLLTFCLGQTNANSTYYNVSFYSLNVVVTSVSSYSSFSFGVSLLLSCLRHSDVELLLFVLWCLWFCLLRKRQDINIYDMKLFTRL